MLEDHPTFRPPEDENTRIWRYMDFTKFVSLLSTQSLFFARADLLGDPFEGSYSSLNVVARQQLLGELPVAKQAADAMSQLCRALPKSVAINCWHMNEAESAAMWRLYLQSNEGIAVRSTVGQLKRSIDSNWPDSLWIGKVTYVDYRNAFIPDCGNLLTPFVYKRSSFEHERELRVVLQRMPKPVESIEDYIEMIDAASLIGCGVSVPVDLAQLIDDVVVAPTTPDWYLELVKDVVKRFNCFAEVTRSQMDGEPLY